MPENLETRVAILEVVVNELRDTMKWAMRGTLITAFGTIAIFLTQLVQGGHHP